MLQKIGSFLEGIWDAILTVIEFVIDFIKDIIYVVQLVGETVLKIPDYIGWLPSYLIATIVAIFAIVIIYKILGREG